MLVLEGLVGLHRTIQLQLLQHYWFGHRLGYNLKNNRIISVGFQGKPFNITVFQVNAPTSNVEEAEVKQFYEDLQDLLELTPKKDVLFIIGDWNAKVESQEIPGVTGNLALEYKMKQVKG